ncbi:MAG: hypothetical protein HXS52_14000 [Theionarchaea archaeon]|nr:hypothetical protein [Theionarchaea archaeon]MBU7039036.1 hypothetical protein [Theionarchaea archaeon]
MVIALDLDRFGELTRKMGWTEYSPNPVTRYLSHAVADFAKTHQATILYGLDFERGTEEAQMYCSHPDMERMITDLETMRKEIRTISETTLSVGIAHITADVPVKALKDFPLAKKALKESKRKGRIVIL